MQRVTNYFGTQWDPIEVTLLYTFWWCV